MTSKKKTVKKKTTKKPAPPEPEQTYAKYELESAKREAFKNGWEAAKLDAFKTLAQEQLRGKTAAFYTCPKVARHVLPLVETRLKELVKADEARAGGVWSVAVGMDFDPFDQE